MDPLRKVAVVGGGIIGVTSAVRAIETIPNIEVTLIADKFTPNTTGDGSGGFWYPYVCGLPERSKKLTPSLSRSTKFWCEKSFEFMLDLVKSSQAKECGVGLLPAYILSEIPIDRPCYAESFLEYRNLSERELAVFPSKYKYGIFVMTLYAECKRLIPMLMKRFESKGGKVIQKKINSLDELAGKYDIVMNCTGLEAGKLASDPLVYPIRGQVIRVKAPWLKCAVVGGGDFYVLPNSEEVVCGGTHQEGNWNREVDPVDTDAIWRGCTNLVPSLKEAEILREWVGLRPGRFEPRVEKEIRNTENGQLEVIHNYGHAGSGVTFSWGSAVQATTLLQESLSSKTRSAKL